MTKNKITQISLYYVDYKHGKVDAHVCRGDTYNKQYEISFESGALSMLYFCDCLATRVIASPNIFPAITYLFEGNKNG